METRVIPPFCCEQIERSKLAREWKSWKCSLECYFDTERIEDQKMRRAKLLFFGGPQLQRVFLNLPDTEKFPLVALVIPYYDVAVQRLDEFFQPVRQHTLERHVLRGVKQRKDERFAQFVLRLRQQAGDCGFDRYIPEVAQIILELTLIDVIVEGCISNELRRRILKEDQTLQQIEELGVMLEGVENQLVNLTTQQTEEKAYRVTTSGTGSKKEVPASVLCYNCGNSGHLSNNPNCPAKNQKCRNCDRVGHFASVCSRKDPSGPVRNRSTIRQQGRWNPLQRGATPRQPQRWLSGQKPAQEESKPQLHTRTVHATENDTKARCVEESADKTYYAFFNGSMTNMISCTVGGVQLDVIIDSGAECNLITVEAWEKLKEAGAQAQEIIKGCTRTLKSYGSENPLHVLGSFKAEVHVGQKRELAEFFVVQGGQQCLLGDETSKKLGVLKVGLDINHVQGDWKPFSKIKGILVQIQVDPKVKPVFQPLRRVPIPLESAVNKKLEQMLARDIIEVKTGPATWVSPLVVVGKTNGEPRLCLDLRRVNEAVLRERYPMPVVDEYLARLGKNMLRTKLDIREAFLQVELDPGSRDVTTFITSKGLFRFKRLCFGLVNAPEVFQQAMDEILTGCEGTFWYLDDVIIEGASEQEHDDRLNKVLHRLKERGVELNWEKCVFRVREMDFLGHRLTSSGIFPSKPKTEAIISFRQPKTEAEVRSFLGLANYMNKFLPNLATIDEPLRHLIQKGAQFVWTEEHIKAFNEIKSEMMNVQNLGYFDLNDQTIVTADASPVGLGAILAQRDSEANIRIINYASKSLTETESRYCQTEKEALALVWAVERFQLYLLGRSFELVTDCKALQYLFTTRSRPCARIERWVLRLQAFEYTVVHVLGENNAADALSRLATVKPKPFDDNEELMIREIAASAACSTALRWQEVETASSEDPEIKQILDVLNSDCQQNLPMNYRVIATELCQVGNVLMRSDRLVIPSKLREKVLELAHEGHSGSKTMKAHLRAHVWWPKMDQNVDNFVKRCRSCCLVAAPDRPEPMVRKDLPMGPWEDVAIDFLGPLPDERQYLLVVVDYYSRFVEVREMTKIDATSTIKELRVIFSRFGLPITLRADNAPQLNEDCEEFSAFCLENGIKLVNTIPYWPQHNGEVERQNRTILKRLKIARDAGNDWRVELSKYLLVYHSTKHDSTGRTPSELMFGRTIRNKMPKVPIHVYEDEEMRDTDKIQKQKGKEYGDRKRKARPSEICVGDTVIMKRMIKSNKLDTEYLNEDFVVTRKNGTDCTVVSCESGKEYRRSSAHLKLQTAPRDVLEPVTEIAEDFDTTEQEDDQQPMDRLTAGDDSPDRAAENPTVAPEDLPEKRRRREPRRFEDYVPL